jgi:hypothetical protein
VLGSDVSPDQVGVVVLRKQGAGCMRLQHDTCMCEAYMYAILSQIRGKSPCGDKQGSLHCVLTQARRKLEKVRLLPSCKNLFRL